MSNKTVLYSADNKVATITLNRPEAANSMSLTLLKDLDSAVDMALADDNVRVVVLAANGKIFCAGADLRDTEIFSKSTLEHLENDHKPILMKIKNSSKPFIAMVGGGAAGVGASYVMLADLCVMSDNAYLYQAFLPIALIPDGGATWLLGNQLGYKRAYELIVDATKLPAEKCVEWGLANKVVALEDLEAATYQWADKLAGRAPLAIAYAKQLLHESFELDYSGAFTREAEAQLVLQQTEDALEGGKAFLEKRTPQFKGK